MIQEISVTISPMMRMERHLALLFLYAHFFQDVLTSARYCKCTTGQSEGCIDGVCTASKPFSSFMCEMSVQLYPNNTITKINYYCLNDLFYPCQDYPYTESTGLTTYYACCKDIDKCNRCLVPVSLPYEAKLQISLDPDCNVTIHTPSPHSTTPPSANSPSSESHYIYAAIAVGCITLLCLVSVPMLVLAAWLRQRHVQSRNDPSVQLIYHG